MLVFSVMGFELLMPSAIIVLCGDQCECQKVECDYTAGQMDGEADWWTISGKIRLPPLARVI